MVISLVFKVTGGPGFSVECDENSTVTELKRLIQQNTNLPANQQRIFFKGKILSDTDVLKTKGISSNGVVLFLVRATPSSNSATPSSSGEDSLQSPTSLSEPPLLCAGGCGFYGSSATKKFCSKCWKLKLDKDENEKKLKEEEDRVAKEKELTAEEFLAPRKEQTDKAKCWKCMKKIGLLGVQCRCGYYFCTEHRYAEGHECEYDYKTNERRKLRKQNPVVVASKMDEKA